MSNEILFVVPPEVAGQAEFKAVTATRDNKTVLTPTGIILKGELNVNHVLKDSKGKLYVWRVPKENPLVIPAIHDEFTQTGFLVSGGSYRLRSVPEQVDFMNGANQTGLKTSSTLYTDGIGILTSFIQGTPFDIYLREGNLSAITNVLDNMVIAHKMDIVFGDRWVKNTIIKPDEDVVEIDFDIALEGAYGKEFEIAQTLYHMVHFSTDRVALLRHLFGYLNDRNIMNNYDTSAVRFFLKKYSEYFQDKEYEGISGGIKKEINDLITYLRGI